MAVLDPVGPGKHLSEFSSYLTDKLIQRFVALGAFTGVLERRRLHDILVQQQLELSAHFDPKTVAPLGKKLGSTAWSSAGCLPWAAVSWRYRSSW